MDNSTARLFLNAYGLAHSSDYTLNNAISVASECIARCEKKKIFNYDDEKAMYYACPTCGAFWYSGDKVQREYCHECGQHLEYPTK